MSSAPLASVVIPACNGGDLLIEVIDAVLKQDAPWPYELIVIDSESDDGSLEGIRRRIAEDDRARLIEIMRSEFSHGRTRNRGVEAAEGEYVAFLTQDAKPCSEAWLALLVAAVSAGENTAGGFGRHVGHPESTCITQQRINRHFDRYKNTPLLHIADENRYRSDIRYRQFLHFYSDNNSCLKKRVWREIPYPEVEFAEDQAWAKLVLEAGYDIAYVDDACVYHSHEYSISSEFRRSSEEAYNFERYLGHGVCSTVGFAVAMAARWTIQDLLCVLGCDRSLHGLGLAVQAPTRNLCRAAGYWHGSYKFRRSGAPRAIMGNDPPSSPGHFTPARLPR